MQPQTMKLRELTIRYAVRKDHDGEPVIVGRALGRPSEAASALMALLQDEPAEAFVILCLTTKFQVIAHFAPLRLAERAVVRHRATCACGARCDSARIPLSLRASSETSSPFRCSPSPRCLQNGGALRGSRAVESHCRARRDRGACTAASSSDPGVRPVPESPAPAPRASPLS